VFLVRVRAVFSRLAEASGEGKSAEECEQLLLQLWSKEFAFFSAELPESSAELRVACS
jgi:hypothetical protein